MKNKLLALAAKAVDLLDQVWRARPFAGRGPQHASDEVATDIGHVGRHRADRVQAWTDRVYRHQGATHWSEWYDEPTGPWPVINGGQWA